MLRESNLIRVEGEVTTVRKAIIRGLAIAVDVYKVQINETNGNICGLKPSWKTLSGFYTNKEDAETFIKTLNGGGRIRPETVLQSPEGNHDWGKCFKRLKSIGQ